MTRNVAAIVIALALVVGGVWYFTQGGDTPAPEQAQTEQSLGEVAAAENSGVVEMILGEADAPVELIEYASFTCPHCASFHEAVFRPLKADYVETGKVKVVFRDVYFDRVGLWAAMVARCGGEERFWGMTDLMMKSQKEWAGSGDPVAITGELKKIGRLAGLSDDTLQSCLQDEAKAKSLVAWSEKNMKAHEITGTPSLIINGEKHPNMSYGDLKKVLDSLIDG